MSISISPLSIKSLPEDLLIEVLVKVATSSLTDLFNAKLAAKDFLEASIDGQIFRHVSLESLPKVPWKTSLELLSFMENCNKNGNLEALYRKGMLEFFTHRKEVSGLANLKASAEKGHAEACYVYGAVLHSAGFEDEGVKFLKKCEGKLGIIRRRVKKFVGNIWINNKISSLEKNFCGDRRSCDCVVNYKNNNKRNVGWNWNDDEDNYGDHTCEACKWSGEVLRFCNMLRIGRYN